MKFFSTMSSKKAAWPLFRVLIILAAIAAAILIINKFANQPNGIKKRFVLIQFNDSPLSDLSQQGIKDGLTSIGLVSKKDYELTVSNAQGDITTLNLMLDAVVTDHPDLVFITSTPTLQAAVKKIKDIPVVFTVVADPILAGAGTSFENHLPYVTGISTLGDYNGMVGWVKTIMPQARVIGTLYTPAEANSVKNISELKKYAEQAGLTLITVPVFSSQEITDATLSLASRKPDVICQVIDNLTSSSSATIIKIAREQKIPVFGFVSDQAKKGAVLVVSRDYHQAGADAVKLAKKILDGESPSKIPFEFVSRTEILLNPEAAAFFKISLPASLSGRSDITIVK